MTIRITFFKPYFKHFLVAKKEELYKEKEEFVALEREKYYDVGGPLCQDNPYEDSFNLVVDFYYNESLPFPSSYEDVLNLVLSFGSYDGADDIIEPPFYREEAKKLKEVDENVKAIDEEIACRKERTRLIWGMEWLRNSERNYDLLKENLTHRYFDSYDESIKDL
ncbi:9053_t:CDS:2, partial [Cetraspora pellucida]